MPSPLNVATPATAVAVLVWPLVPTTTPPLSVAVTVNVEAVRLPPASWISTTGWVPNAWP